MVFDQHKFLYILKSDFTNFKYAHWNDEAVREPWAEKYLSNVCIADWYFVHAV